MPYERRTGFNRLIGALRYLDDSELIRAWRTAIRLHESAQPGLRHARATERLKACELIVGERFHSEDFGEQA